MTTPNTPTGLLRILGQEKDMNESDGERMESAANRMSAPQPQQAAPALAFSDAVRIARGCTDYGGGHRGKDTYEVYQHGTQTVIAALEAAERRGLEDTQVRALHCMGAATPPQQAPAPQPVGLTMADAAKGFASYGGVPEGHAVSALWFARGIAFAERTHGIPQANQQEQSNG